MTDLVNWLYVDFNSYFASVEQQLDPRLRGKPIAVVPMLAHTTSVIAASYEAKAFGIKTGTPVWEAKKLCPKILLRTGNHEQYVKYHHKLVEAVENCLPVTSVCSIDEIACKLTGPDQIIENATQLAKDIKKRIFKDVGTELRCSIGLAPNRYLAKVAADMQKPDGLTIVTKSDLPQKMYKLKLRDLPGIGYRMEERLLKAEIKTVEQLYQQTLQDLRKIWGGVGGEYFYRWIRGDHFELSFNEHQSLGHYHVLAPELRARDGACAVGQKMVHKLGVRLRKLDMWTRSISVRVKYLDKPSWGDDLNMLECQDTLTLLEAYQQLWKRLPKGGTPLKVSVTLYNFIHDSERTFSFFENKSRQKLGAAMDKLNNKYGKNTVYFAGMHEVQMAAPTRIAFQSIPDIDI